MRTTDFKCLRTLLFCWFLFLALLLTACDSPHSPVVRTPNTSLLPPTRTDCPPEGAARPQITAPLIVGAHPNIVYLPHYRSSTSSQDRFNLVRYDVIAKQSTSILSDGRVADISSARISPDGQWILISGEVYGRNAIAVVRLDGQGFQTLYCAPSDATIAGAEWSPDQRSIILEVNTRDHVFVYVLDLPLGKLELQLDSPSTDLKIGAFLDITHVYLIGSLVKSPYGIYLLDFTKGSHQHERNLQQVTTFASDWKYSVSTDGERLFVFRRLDGGRWMISIQPALGGAQQEFFTPADLDVQDIELVGPGDIYLLLIASNAVSQNGIWKIKVDGSDEQRLSSDDSLYRTLSFGGGASPRATNISRDGTLYAVEERLNGYIIADGTFYENNLQYGSLEGGEKITFDDGSCGTTQPNPDQICATTPGIIVGWTVM